MLEALANIRRMLGDIETTDDETCRMSLCLRLRMELAKLDKLGELIDAAKAVCESRSCLGRSCSTCQAYGCEVKRLYRILNGIVYTRRVCGQEFPDGDARGCGCCEECKAEGSVE